MIPATPGPKILEMARNRNFDQIFSGILNLEQLGVCSNIALTSRGFRIAIERELC
jgi:hypothetical protein